MAYIKIIILLVINILNLMPRQKITKSNMLTIQTILGEIAYAKKDVSGSTPIVFLHGVYYDHNLWNYYTNRISNHTTIAIDMPLHGRSKVPKEKNWSMEDCASMLIEVLDSLGIEKCYAIGHSWGSMTILRAASQHPDRFTSIVLCNMPLDKGGFTKRLQFGLQHILLPFRRFYVAQVAKAMFSKQSRNQKPEIREYLDLSMSQLSGKEIRTTDKVVITNVDSGYPFLENLTVPAIAIKGKDDYVPNLKSIKMITVHGKHTSPLEQPEEVIKIINNVLKCE